MKHRHLYCMLLGMWIFMPVSAQNTSKTTSMDTIGQYTFKMSEHVKRQKVSFNTRYGITLSGDLYTPVNLPATPVRALAISGPFGAVKEQSSGLYANQMAERGYVALAFDPSYTGESGGEPHNIGSPDIYTEDFSAAVDFLGLLSYVDRDKIGVIGICGFGGFALNATIEDTRIKAAVTTSMYDMTRIFAKGYYDSMTESQRAELKNQLATQRWKDAENGTQATSDNHLPDSLIGNEPQFVKDYFDYYKTVRGFHPNSINSNQPWKATNAISFMHMPILNYLNEIAPRPILLIAGANAHSRYMTEDIYEAAASPKELVIIPDAVHVDLYDNITLIPFDKIDAFFRESLR